MNKKAAEVTGEDSVQDATEGQVEQVKMEEPAPDPYADLEYPCLVHVKKGDDEIPVTVKSREHLDQLTREHAIRVQA